MRGPEMAPFLQKISHKASIFRIICNCIILVYIVVIASYGIPAPARRVNYAPLMILPRRADNGLSPVKRRSRHGEHSRL